MRRVLAIVGTAAVLLTLLAACSPILGAGGSGQTHAAPTLAPAATEAPGSTQAAPAGTSVDANVASAAPGGTKTATPALLADQNPTEPPSTTAPEPPVTPAPIATAAPEPAMPPAPTAPSATEVAPAVVCTPGALTPAQTEGPYYKANPPESSTLLQPGMNGTKLIVTGYVLDAQCKPVSGARVDFWQADSEGQYDNQGYTLRGYQVTGADGHYSVETVVPGLYPGRTRHIHVKVTPPAGPALTTQLYLPGEAANAVDGIFSPELVMNLQPAAGGEVGRFDFVLQTR